MTIGKRIKDAREAKGATQDELAKAANTTKQTIYKYENGIVSITDVMDAVTDEGLALSAQALHQIELLKKKYELKHTTYVN